MDITAALPRPRWTARRWGAAVAVGALTVVVVGIPTALIPTGVFGRGVPAAWWTWPALLVTAALSGLLTATYVREPGTAPAPDPDRPRRGGLLGTLLTYLAVGCPTCNKLALLALGTSGAVRWFAPVQPLLALAGILLLAYALRRRLDGESRCDLPPRPTAPGTDGPPIVPLMVGRDELPSADGSRTS